MKAGMKRALIGSAIAIAAIAIYVATNSFSGTPARVDIESSTSASHLPDTTGETGSGLRDVIRGDAIDRLAVKQLGPPPAPMTSQQQAELAKAQQGFAALRAEVAQQQAARLKQLATPSGKSATVRPAGKEG